MSDSRRKAVLEEVLYSPDSTPAERLKAAELIRELEDHTPDFSFDAELRELPDQVLDEQLDAFLVVDVVRAIARGEEVNGVEPDARPQSRDALQVELDRIVHERVEQRTDVAGREREIAERAEKWAREVYATRSSAAISGSDPRSDRWRAPRPPRSG